MGEYKRTTTARPIALSGRTRITALAHEPQACLVPAGVFLMGTRQEELDDLYNLMEQEKKGMPYEQRLRESPQFELYLPAYAIGRYPIANGEYAEFVSNTGHSPPKHWNGEMPPEALTHHPVVNVTWLDAVAYCSWLSRATGKDHELPTEAQWERAARGGDARRYPWGSEWDPSLCNNAETGPKTTMPGGSFSPGGDSPYGCADMIGQVWEWCSSRYGGTGVVPEFMYPYDPTDGREDMEFRDSRILRGGSFFNGRGRARCEYRGRGAMTHHNDHTGFRVVRATDP